MEISWIKKIFSDRFLITREELFEICHGMTSKLTEFNMHATELLQLTM